MMKSLFFVSACLNAIALGGLYSHCNAQDSQPAKREAFQDIPDAMVGNLIEWEGWRFRWQFRDIEGLVLSDVYFQDRKVLKMINLAEIYVPYASGQPRPEDFAFGGFKANPMPLLPGQDCQANGAISCQAFNRDGKETQGSTADVMIHEEPGGLTYVGKKGRAAGKNLVLWTMAHFPGIEDGYTYLLKWKFKKDGSLCVEVGATGGLQHLGVGEGTEAGTYVGRNTRGEMVFAPTHVHNFYFRIDFDIDGTENTAEEFSYERDPDDPSKAIPRWRPLVGECGRYLTENTFRSWRVMNPHSFNEHGYARSYHLMPGSRGAWKDGGFPVLSGDFFITKYRESEFPYTKQDGRRMLAALADYVNGEPTASSDIVSWYRLSFVHHPRTEDWPLQGTVWNSFELMPRDFLDQSSIETIK